MIWQSPAGYLYLRHGYRAMTFDAQTGSLYVGHESAPGAVGGVDVWTSTDRHGYDPALGFGPLTLAPGPVTLTTSPLGEYSCDTAAWLDLELAPR